MNSRVAPLQFLETVNYFIDHDLGKDIHSGRKDFEKVFSNLSKNPSKEGLEGQLKQIITHYTDIMNSSETLLYYLCFGLGIGIVPKKRGYALDPFWAKGAYKAAKKDYRVYSRLIEVASANLVCGKNLPPQIKVFIGEVLAGTFPVPKKNGPAKTRNQIRNLCISECMMLLCDEYKMQIGSDAKEPKPEARVLVYEAFIPMDFKVPGVAKPTVGVVNEVWKNEKRPTARYEVKMLRWLEKKEKSNRWYKYATFLYWMNINHQ